jgi:hypothetical protein
LLGRDYPGYFPVGDTEALTVLLHRAETDSHSWPNCAGIAPLARCCSSQRASSRPGTTHCRNSLAQHGRLQPIALRSDGTDGCKQRAAAYRGSHYFGRIWMRGIPETAVR